jgi:hypothetical protein
MDPQGPRPIPNEWHLPELPWFSLQTTVNSGNFVSFQTLIGFFIEKSFWYGRPFFFSVDLQNRGLVGAVCALLRIWSLSA